MQNEVTIGESKEGKVGGPVARHPDSDGKFLTTVNASAVKFSDPMPKGGHILEKAHMTPASEYVLIQLMGHGTRSIGLDEPVDLRIPGTEAFRAFKSDRLFRFTLNGHGWEWGVDKIPELELRVIGHVHKDEVLVLERDGDDVELKANDVLDLSHDGTEHLYTEKRLVTVYFENEPREIPRGSYTTEELDQLLGVQQGYVLEFINDEGQLTPLKPGVKTRVKQGMKFYEQVPCGGSS